MTDSTSTSKNKNIVRPAGAAALIAATGAALLAYSLKIEPLLLEETQPVLSLPRLPAALDGASILLLADTHVSEYGAREEKLVRLLQKRRAVEVPDLIVWAGDMIQRNGQEPTLRLMREVRCLFPDVPTFAIPGNAEHKLRIHRRQAFLDEIENLGVPVLLNRHLLLPIRGETIVLAGVDDPYYGHADLKVALEGAPVAERFTLLLAHSPQIATQAARAGVDLMVSGHTHGGQVRLPFIGPLKTQNPLARRMDWGLWDRARLADVLGYDPGGDLVTYISRGIGVAPLPRLRRLGPRLAPRFLCRPEVPLLRLKRATPEIS